MNNSETFAVLFWANKSKSDQNGTIPVYARVTVLGRRAEISLKKRVAPEKWDVKSGRMTGTNEEARSFNKFLGAVDTELRDIYFKFKQHDQPFSAKRLKTNACVLRSYEGSCLKSSICITRRSRNWLARAS